MVPITIRIFDAAQDSGAVYALWEATIGEVWPTTAEAFHQVLTGYESYTAGDHLVALRGAQILGFVATQAKPNSTDATKQGSIPLIMVAPEAQRQGIGSMLLDAALERLRAEKVSTVQSGAGGHTYFWPGVPENLPGGIAFFGARGWDRPETSFDLLRDVSDYATPPGLHERIAAEEVTIRTPGQEDIQAVYAFECEHFPSWASFFLVEYLFFSKKASSILAAWDAEGNVIGTLLLFTEEVGDSQAKLWKPLLGNDMGGLGAVGVAEAWREKGIGTALVARASEILKERGVRNSHIGWTWLLDFYGRLGYAPWRSYAMFHKEIIKG